MKINLSTQYINLYKLQPSFSKRKVTSEKILSDYALIEEAVMQISNNPALTANISTISKLTGLSYTTTYNRLYSNCKQGERLSGMLNAIKEKRGANQIGTEQYVTSMAQEDYQKIKRAILEIKKNDEYRLSQRQIVMLTGIPHTTISHRLNSNNKYTKEIGFLWQEVKTHKDSIQKKEEEERKKEASINPLKRYRKEDMTRDSLLAQRSREKAQKLKQYTKAIRLINEAITSKRKISYRELETQCSLTKEEIDELIQKYAKFKEQQQENAKIAKGLQKKWHDPSEDK